MELFCQGLVCKMCSVRTTLHQMLISNFFCMRHIQYLVLSISEFTGHLLFILAFDSNDLRFCSTEIKLVKSELSSIDVRKDQELSGASIREKPKWTLSPEYFILDP